MIHNVRTERVRRHLSVSQPHDEDRQVFSCAAVGALGYSLGGPVGCYVAAVVGSELGNLVGGKTPVDIVLIPLVTLITGGLTAQCAAGEAAVRFLLAGGDLILCGPQHGRQREIMEALYQAAADGTLSEARIDESVTRILQKKMQVTGWSPAASEG